MLKKINQIFVRLVGFLLLAISATSNAWGKSVDDVVILKNGDRITGEIKSLRNGELRFKSSYMAEPVRLDWARVERLESKDRYQIFLTSGEIFTDFLKLTPSDATVVKNFLIGEEEDAIRVEQLEVVRIALVDARFLRQLEGSVDMGFSYNSGIDHYQADLAATATYRRGSDSWTASVDSSLSGQRQGTSLARNEFSLDYRKQVSTKWYVGGLFDLLHSDQQSLSLRTTAGGVIGRNFVQGERTRLSLFAGLVGTHENYFSVGNPRATNADATAGIDFVTFRFSTTEISSRLILYPSITTPGRTRMQATSNMRLKIASDLYWNFRLYENFDSKPPVSANRNDLGVSTSIGWKF